MLTRDDAAWVADAVERDRTEGALRAAQTLLHAIDQLDRLAAQYANTDGLGRHEADVIERYGRIAQELQDGRERLAELLDDKTVLAELDAANPRPVIVGGLPEQNVCMAIARLAVSREDSLRLVGWHRFSKRQTLTVQECLQAVAQHEPIDQRMVDTELRKEWQRVQDNRRTARPPMDGLNETEVSIIEAIERLWGKGLEWPTAADIAPEAGIETQTAKNNLAPLFRHKYLDKSPNGQGYKVRT